MPGLPAYRGLDEVLGLTDLGRAGPAFGVRHDFAVSAPAVSGLPPGTYQDTVTITIAAR